MFAFYENKIYGDYMETKARRQTAREHPVRNGEVAGANPAESTNFLGRSSIESQREI